MVAEIRLYIEGGGDSAETKRQLRRGFHQFFMELISGCRARRIKVEIILCGGRGAAFNAFARAVVDHPDASNVLIVDAECPVSKEPWDHLKESDGWVLPGREDERCFLMVQVMEAWFLADAHALEVYYSDPKFHANALPKAKDVELIEKAAVYRAIADATRHTKKGEYRKIRDASALLAKVRPETVRNASRHCELMFHHLDELIRSAR